MVSPPDQDFIQCTLPKQRASVLVSVRQVLFTGGDYVIMYFRVKM